MKNDRHKKRKAHNSITDMKSQDMILLQGSYFLEAAKQFYDPPPTSFFNIN